MFQNILQSITVKAFVAIINFCILIISSKYLGVSSRGEISIFILNLSIIQGINEIFTGYSIIYFVPKYNFRKIFVNGLIFTFIFSTLSNLIIVWLNKQIVGYEYLGFVVSILVILNTFNSMLLLGKQAIRTFNFLAALQPFILLLGILISVFYFKEFTFLSFLWPLFYSFLISFLVSSFLLYKEAIKINVSHNAFNLNQIVTSGLYYQSAILLFIFCNRYSFYLLNDNKKVGLYGSACMLMEAVLLVVNSIAPILVSKVANQNAGKQTASLALSIAKLAFLSSVFIVLLIGFIPERWIIIFLGEGFIGVKPLMMAYSPGILMLSFFTIINHYFSGIGKQQFILFSIASGFTVSLIFAPFLIEKYDTLGAAYTANLSYLTILISVLSLFFLESKMKWTNLFSIKNDFALLLRLINNKI